jgi:hypothetical protein
MDPDIRSNPGTHPRTVLKLPSIGRFLLGTALFTTGVALMLSAAITVIGLPVGLMVFAAALDLMLNPSSRQGRATEKEA